VKKGILFAIVGSMGLMFLGGCDNQGNKAVGTAAQPKAPTFPYKLAFDTAAAKPNPSGITIPAVKYTAKPGYVERRASLVVWFDPSGAKKNQTVLNQIILAPFDISGTEGTISADTIKSADEGLASLLGSYGLKGKIKVKVVLVRSSITPTAGDEEIDAKRLSDWLPIELDFKNPHSKS
jgi:hypothetical protein